MSHAENLPRVKNMADAANKKLYDSATVSYHPHAPVPLSLKF